MVNGHLSDIGGIVVELPNCSSPLATGRPQQVAPVHLVFEMIHSLLDFAYTVCDWR